MNSEISGAIFSDCRKYRYDLWRVWDKSKSCVVFIGLNPSTANEIENSPTLNKCVAYAKRFEFGGLHMINLFAYIATNPKDMLIADDPIGIDNNRWISQICNNRDTIAVWSNHGKHRNRDVDVKKLIANLKCLKINKNGTPAHPLYLSKDIIPIKYED